MINIIAVIGNNNELGIDNHLLWNIPSDLKYFKSVTMGYPVVMGKKTYESIGKPLPGRKNIVLSNSLQDDRVIVINDINEVLKMKEDVFVIGGASVYKMFLPYANNLYLTLVDDSPKADVYFPEFNKSDYDYELVNAIEENNLKLKFVVYRRKNNE